MGNVAIHYQGEVEVARVYTACMISMLRLAEHVRMTAFEEAAFGYAHTMLAEFMGRLDERAIDEWRKGIVTALEEMRLEDQKDGRHREGHATDTGGNGAHQPG